MWCSYALWYDKSSDSEFYGTVSTSLLYIQCSSPFVGNNFNCTLDSDLDTYPDVAIQDPACSESAAPYCFADICSNVYNPSQTASSCELNATVVGDGRCSSFAAVITI